ncbi:MAG: hotdog fold thioesterase [Bacteroidia bacterium]|nr:hotdog fold thioesterase [Bacteroidia bacterium]
MHIAQTMMQNDAYSQWLGMELLEVKQACCKVKMTVTSNMTNGFGIAHGGITYALADSAFAFACNSHGRKSVSVETSISHTAPVQTGDELIAVATELSLSNKIGVYQIVITCNNKTVALFKGTCYRTSKHWALS